MIEVIVHSTSYFEVVYSYDRAPWQGKGKGVMILAVQAGMRGVVCGVTRVVKVKARHVIAMYYFRARMMAVQLYTYICYIAQSHH